MAKPCQLLVLGGPRRAAARGRPCALVAVLTLLFWPPVLAAGADLTLAEAVSLAISQHPQLQAAQAAVARERGHVFQAGRKPNPVLGYSAAEIGNGGQAGQQGVFINQNLPRGGKIPLDVEIRRWELAGTRADQDLALCQVEAFVSRHFVAAAEAGRRLALLEQLQAHWQLAVTRTEKLVATGFVKRPVLLSLQLQARRNRIAAQQQQQQADAALWQLGAAMGIQAAPSSVAGGLLDAPPAAWDIEQLWQDLRGRSPQLARTRADHQRSLWALRRADVEVIPDLQTQFTFQHDTATYYPVVGVQVGVEAPVHDRNRGARSAARAETRRTHTHMQAVELDLRGRLAEVLRRHESARQRLAASDRELRQLVAENLRVIEDAYDNKEATAREVLEARRADIEVRLADLTAKRDLALALISLHTCLVK